MKAFDLEELAPNGMKRGITTGTCAAAAALACAVRLFHGEDLKLARVGLPDQGGFLEVPISSCQILETGRAFASVVKFAGDDPDVTDGATITVELQLVDSGGIVFEAGEGVGIVTAKGIRVAVGEPAINPVPRKMIVDAIRSTGGASVSAVVTVGCIEGLALADRTFNPRLGIKGGISILGTTGIVEPMSLSAYRAAVEVYIRVALSEALGGGIAILPGNIGIKYARDKLSFSRRRIVHISNFLGFSIHTILSNLEEECRSIESLWLLGHPGKLCKCLGGYWDTHSSNSPMATDILKTKARHFGFDSATLSSIKDCLTVDALITSMKENKQAFYFWQSIESEIVQSISQEYKLSSQFINSLEVKLFDYQGVAIGRDR